MSCGCGPTIVLFYLLNKPKIIIIYYLFVLGVNPSVPIQQDQIIRSFAGN